MSHPFGLRGRLHVEYLFFRLLTVILTYFQLMCAAGWFTVSGRSENQEIGPLCLLGFWTHDYPRFKVAEPRVEKGKIEAFLRSLGPPLGQVHSHMLPNEPVPFWEAGASSLLAEVAEGTGPSP